MQPSPRFPSILILLACAAATARGANPEASQLVVKGDAEVRAMHTEAALALFEKAARLDPDDVELTLRLSQQNSNLIAHAPSPADAERYARRSLELARQAVQRAPDNALAHLAVAVAYGRLTDFVDNRTKVEFSRLVKAEADKSLQLDPREDFGYHVLGRWNYRIAMLNPLMKLVARVVYGSMPEASYEDSARCFKKAIEIAPQRLIHHFELARTYVAMGEKDEARREWEKVLTMTPEDHEGENDQKEARAELEKK